MLLLSVRVIAQYHCLGGLAAMATKIANPPAPFAQAASRGIEPLGGAAIVVLAPAAAASAALALHLLLPNIQEPPLNWLDGLPAWKHPYPIILAALCTLSLLAAGSRWMFSSLRPATRSFAPLAAGVAILLAGWDFITVKMNWLHQPFFPGPDEVFGAMVEDRAILAVSAWHSLQLLLAGYFSGVSAGFVTGVLVGWFPTVRYWAMPAIKLIGPIPATALIPLVMTLWRDSFPCAVALIGFAVWFPVVILTSSGIANVKLSYLDVARTLGAGQGFLIFRVAIPAALPNIFVGLFMGLGASFLSLIVAETVGVKDGLGWYMSWQRGYMEYAKVYATLIISAIFFSTIMTFLFKVRDRALRWQQGVIKW